LSLWCWILYVALAHLCMQYEDHCRIGVLSVIFNALVTVVLDSACSTDTVLCCVWDHYLTVCCHCTVNVVHGLVRFACPDWPVLCACCVVAVMR